MEDIEKIKRMLEDHEKRISKLEKLFESKPSKISLEGEKIISNLINSGFFNNPKKHADIIKELKTRAKFDKNTNYQRILSTLTQEDKLTRKIVHHQWMYFKNG